MDRVSLYDDDIYAWSREQAEALRRLAATRPDLPNDLDVANIAEEIEDVGKSELHRVESFLELLLRHLLKVASVPDARPARHWMVEIEIQHGSAVKEYRRSMRQAIDLDDLWHRAALRAGASLEDHGDRLLEGLPASCPFSLDHLCDRRFDPREAVRRIRDLASPPGSEERAGDVA